MGLDSSVFLHVDRILRIIPIYGWGWDGNAEQPFPPREFTARLIRIWPFQGETRGGVAKVEQTGHPFHEFWLVFSTRHGGTFNFTDKVGDYNVAISDQAPVDRDGWPQPIDASHHVVGFAEITLAQHPTPR